MIRATTLVIPAMLLLAATSVGAADLEAGEKKAAACTGCHGAGFAGKSAAEIEEGIAAIASGQKMHPASLSNISPEDAANIAAYLESVSQ